MPAYKKLISTMLFATSCLLTTFCSQVLANETTQTSDYKLNAGDKVLISVANEAEFTREVTLNNTCSFNYPYLGKVEAAGLTIKQLQQKLLQGLKPKYLTNPDIRVDLTQYHGIFITGEVTNPGHYDFRQKLTILQAVALAGGFNSRADTKTIQLIKAGSNKAIEVNPNTALNPGDTIKVNKGSVFF